MVTRRVNPLVSEPRDVVYLFRSVSIIAPGAGEVTLISGALLRFAPDDRDIFSPATTD